MADIRQGLNLGEITGILSEKNLQKITNVTKDASGKEVPCETIRGSIVVEAGENNPVTINVYCNSVTRTGNRNKAFDGFDTIMTTNISKAELAVHKISYKTGTHKTPFDKLTEVTVPIAETVEHPTKLNCKVTLRVNDYFNSDKNEMVSKTEPSLNYAKSVPMETPDKAVAVVEGVVVSVRDEYVNEEETGRKLLDFIHIGYQGAVTPISAVVDKEKFGRADWGEKFATNFPTGTSCELSFAFTTKHVGDKKESNEDTFMGMVVEIASGYDIPELTFIGAKNPFDENSVDKDGVRMQYTREEVQTVMNERKMKLEAKEAEGKAKAKKSTTTKDSIASRKQAVSDTQAQSNVNAWF